MSETDGPMNVTVFWNGSAYVASTDLYPGLNGISDTQVGALQELVTAIEIDLKAFKDFSDMVKARTTWLRELNRLKEIEQPTAEQLIKIAKLKPYEDLRNSMQGEGVKILVPAKLANVMVSWVKKDAIGWREDHVFNIEGDDEIFKIELHDADYILNDVANAVYRENV